VPAVGVTNTRHKASINHAEIAQAVADSLEELGQDIAYWNEVIIEHGRENKMIMRYIMSLYVIVFEFLTEIFDKWSRSSMKRQVYDALS
jgi:hypothetical protein